ncbi:Protein of unknown function [Gryllus bimaculatus]|nr:Protein of unknown function [Gryllus bimaculatus]
MTSRRRRTLPPPPPPARSSGGSSLVTPLRHPLEKKRGPSGPVVASRESNWRLLSSLGTFLSSPAGTKRTKSSAAVDAA